MDNTVLNSEVLVEFEKVIKGLIMHYIIDIFHMFKSPRRKKHFIISNCVNFIIRIIFISLFFVKILLVHVVLGKLRKFDHPILLLFLPLVPYGFVQGCFGVKLVWVFLSTNPVGQADGNCLSFAIFLLILHFLNLNYYLISEVISDINI